eukprot:303846-Hanusia_phi.AAC.1
MAIEYQRSRAIALDHVATPVLLRRAQPLTQRRKRMTRRSTIACRKKDESKFVWYGLKSLLMNDEGSMCQTP